MLPTGILLVSTMTNLRTVHVWSREYNHHSEWIKVSKVVKLCAAAEIWLLWVFSLIQHRIYNTSETMRGYSMMCFNVWNPNKQFKKCLRTSRYKLIISVLYEFRQTEINKAIKNWAHCERNMYKSHYHPLKFYIRPNSKTCSNSYAKSTQYLLTVWHVQK